NLLYDFSQVPIPTDTVDPNQTTKPRPWHIGDIRKFVLFIGPVSSIFDYTTFFVMLYLFGCWDPVRASLFQTGWFVESLITQTLIIHVIRTNKLPFIHGRASWPVTMATLIVIAIAIWLPSSPIAAVLGFTPLPPLYWPILAATVFCYVALTQVVKTWLLSKMWI
ncbi:MAG: cation transporting ATPase C-terminal domain-containing protein, partial [Limisphaerales bacterium]